MIVARKCAFIPIYHGAFNMTTGLMRRIVWASARTMITRCTSYYAVLQEARRQCSMNVATPWLLTQILELSWSSWIRKTLLMLVLLAPNFVRPEKHHTLHSEV